MREGRAKEAEAEALKGVSMNPTSAEAYAVLGLALLAKKDYAGAERACRIAVRLSPGNAAMLYNLAIVVAKQGRTKESRQLYERAKKVDPSLYTGKDYSKRAGR